MKSNLTILQVNDYDIAGGAEVISMNLFQSYLKRGYLSYLFVGTKRGSDTNVREIPLGLSCNPWEKLWLTAADFLKPYKYKKKIGWTLFYICKFIAHPINTLQMLTGKNDNDFPATWALLTLISEKPDILHLHNLHNGYFDLRALAYLSNRVPVIITLHDTWLLGDHCGSFFSCSQSSTNCLKCSNPSVVSKSKEKTQYQNYNENFKLLKNSRVFVTTPSQWMMNFLRDSELNQFVIDSKVIPNGIDLNIFYPTDKTVIRRTLGLPENAKILLFVASGIRKNSSKDYTTLRNAVSLVANRMRDEKILFLAIGESSKTSEKIGDAEIQFLPFIQDSTSMANYYQAADLYIHASFMESWGLTITESLACGTPVVATSVGGIPEQIIDGFNGYLTKPGDSLDMAEKIEKLLRNDILRGKMGNNSARYAKDKFDLDFQADRYLDWYRTAIEIWKNVQVPHERDMD
jgi:glycosyltransferase involved in cell wall biosynthesis